MADFDPTVALQAKGFQPNDMIAPLQAYNLASEANTRDAQTNIQTQSALATFGARQKYGTLVQGGMHPEDAIIQSGMSAMDPAGANQQLANVSSQRQLGAIRNYDPNNPTSLAKGGPALVGQGATALGTEATAAKTQQETAAAKVNLRGQIANGFLSALRNPDNPNMPVPQPAQDLAWGLAVGQAHAAGEIGNLHVADAMKYTPEQRLAIAKYWAGSGSGSVTSSGMAKGAEEAAQAPYMFKTVPNTDTPYVGSALLPSAGGAQPAGGALSGAGSQGRSAATDTGGGALANYAARYGGSPVAPAAPPASPAPTGTTTPAAGSASGDTGSGALAGYTDARGRGAAPAVPSVIAAAAAKYGVSADYLARTAQIESANNPSAHNANSGAAGLFQFTPSTWRQYGDQGASPNDPAAATEAAARLTADNVSGLTKSLGRVPTPAETYLAHQQGASGAAKLLSNPDARAADVVGMQAVLLNGGDKNMTAGQFAAKQMSRFTGASGGTSNFGPGGFTQAGPGVGAMPASPTGAAALSQLPEQGASGTLPGSAATPALSSLEPREADRSPVSTPAFGTPSRIGSTNDGASASSIQPGGGIPTGRSASSGNLPASAPPIAAVPRGLTMMKPGLTVSQKAEQEAQGRDLGNVPGHLADDANNARQQSSLLDQMSVEAQGFRQGWGASAQARAGKMLEGLADGFGIGASQGLRNYDGSYDSFVKNAGIIARTATAATTSHSGIMELNAISSSLPSPETSPNGFRQVVASLQGLNDFKIAKQQAAYQWRNEPGNNGSLDGFETDWNKNASPSAFWVSRMDPNDMKTMAANLQKTPEGRATLTNMSANLKWLQQRGLLGVGR